jgi:hypothetical protein
VALGGEWRDAVGMHACMYRPNETDPPTNASVKKMNKNISRKRNYTRRKKREQEGKKLGRERNYSERIQITLVKGRIF